MLVALPTQPSHARAVKLIIAVENVNGMDGRCTRRIVRTSPSDVAAAFGGVRRGKKKTGTCRRSLL